MRRPEVRTRGVAFGTAHRHPAAGNAVRPVHHADHLGGSTGELQGAWAAAASPRGAVLVIHENKGLNDWVRSVAGRLAGAGYSALAIDLLSEEGGTWTFADLAAATAALGTVAPSGSSPTCDPGWGVGARVPNQKSAAVGFCFGGGLVWRLLAAGEPRLAAAVPFYGPLPDNPDFAGSRGAAVLGFYGALDQRVTDSEPAARAAAAGRSGPRARRRARRRPCVLQRHRPRYQPAAAADAWRRLQDWFAAHLG